MKQIIKLGLLTLILGVLNCINVSAQIDMTDLLTNPSFETGDYTGWTWTGRTGGWQDVNTDGDETKDGNYIGGHWNDYIADVEIYQHVEVPNGTYRVSALVTVESGRVSNQRLFANNNSTLYASAEHPAYSEGNLDILTGLDEVYSFAGVTPSSVENGPFIRIYVDTEVTEGVIRLGFKFSGLVSDLGFAFSYDGMTGRPDVGFFKFDGFTLEQLSTSSLKETKISDNAIVDVYSLTGAKIQSKVAKKEAGRKLEQGVYILKNENISQKIVVLKK